MLDQLEQKIKKQYAGLIVKNLYIKIYNFHIVKRLKSIKANFMIKLVVK